VHASLPRCPYSAALFSFVSFVFFVVPPVDYPRTIVELGDFTLPWTCGHNIGFPDCDAGYVTTSLADKDELNREYAISNDNCPVEPDTDPVKPDTDPVDDTDGDEASGTQTYLYAFSMTLAGAIVIVGTML
jgi:hypothetical protein